MIQPDAWDMNRINAFTQEQLARIKLENLIENEVCSICLENMEIGSEARSLPGCSHRFHTECINDWLIRRPHCPYCRRQITQAELEPQLNAV